MANERCVSNSSMAAGSGSFGIAACECGMAPRSRTSSSPWFSLTMAGSAPALRPRSTDMKICCEGWWTAMSLMTTWSSVVPSSAASVWSSPRIRSWPSKLWKFPSSTSACDVTSVVRSTKAWTAAPAMSPTKRTLSGPNASAPADPSGPETPFPAGACTLAEIGRTGPAAAMPRSPRTVRRPLPAVLGFMSCMPDAPSSQGFETPGVSGCTRADASLGFHCRNQTPRLAELMQVAADFDADGLVHATDRHGREPAGLDQRRHDPRRLRIVRRVEQDSSLR